MFTLTKYAKKYSPKLFACPKQCVERWTLHTLSASNFKDLTEDNNDLATVTVATLYRCYTCFCIKYHFVYRCQIAGVGLFVCWVCNDLAAETKISFNGGHYQGCCLVLVLVLILLPHPCVQLFFFLYRRLAYAFPPTLVLYVEWRYSCTCAQCVPDHLWNRFGRLDLNLSLVHFECIYTCCSLSTKNVFIF